MFNRNRRADGQGRVGRPTVRIPTAGWRLSPSTKRMLVTAGIIAALFLVVYVTAAFWVNWWWFGSIGYRSVLTTRYTAQAVSFLVGGLAAAGFFFGNLVVALRRSRGDVPRGPRLPFAERLILPLLLAASAVVFVAAGSAAASRWDEWLLWLHGEEFGVADPVFGRDVGFYVFTLPALTALRAGATSLLITTTIGVIAVYALRLGINVRNYRLIPDLMRIHVLALGGALLLLVAAGYILANYDLVYSTRGVAFGASYTDVNAQRWANWALTAISALTALLLILNAFVRRVRWLLAAVGVWAVLAFLLGIAYPAAIQRTVVEPSELRRERPYIEQNIEMTRIAYDVDDVTTRDLSGQGTLQPADLAAQPATVDNIRLWDYRIIGTTYQQIQSFVSYYVFYDVDVDRYLVDGTPQQVVISARELDVEGLPETAQTWVNRHLVYTHGYGVVVSPVSALSPQGLPMVTVGNIPPTGTGVFAIERPQIYFGEESPEWVILNTSQQEFDGLQGEPLPDAEQGYQGEARGSIGLGSLPTRLIAATYLGDRNVLLSGHLESDSRVLIRRNVVERARIVAPFLTYDGDPYIVIANGRLYWVIDAYTTTDRFPDATRTRDLNYIRNSVKVVIDAYDGTMTFYRTTTPDPIADAYADIFDDLFTPIAEAPPEIASHFRYPELLFNVQSEIYASYHVTDPTAFYNGEDRWAIAREQVGGAPQRMEPYYVTMTLPEEQQADFGLILPFTPGGRQDRQNMTAWMAGRTEGDAGVRLVVYRFPRQVTVFGPSQIEARINQEPDISSQITLWNQSGSTVVRGNLLVIPIGESVLYVQPLYLQASASEGALPELKRVIVASSERVVMRPTLDEALAALLTGGSATTGPLETTGETATTQPPPTPSGEVPALVQQALDAYARAQDALSRGDWATYGQEQANLEAILQQLATLTGTPATPPATPSP